MCIFSSEVESVSKTEIFARRSGTEKQFLVYRMNYEANQELAMILPLPTPPTSPDDAVRFIDLSGYPEFFKDMNIGFETFDDVGSRGMSRSTSKSILEVQEVGNFEASFVPKLQDFERLDSRFCLPENTWDWLPQCHNYGFAVFKLKPGNFAAHPMAFEFPTRIKKILFFPTVHVHDAKVAPFAYFDHTLYLQSQNFVRNSGWEASNISAEEQVLAEEFVEIDRTEKIVDGKMAIHRRSIKGKNPNVDIWVNIK